MFPGVEVYYMAACNGDCEPDAIYATYDFGGDVDVFGKKGSIFNGGEKCSPNMCFCGGTGSHPSMEKCTSFGKVYSDKFYLTIRSPSHSTNVKVKVRGNNIKYVKKYTPSGGENNGLKVKKFGSLKKGERRYLKFKCNGLCKYHALFAKHRFGGDVDVYGGAKMYMGGLKCPYTTCMCSGSSAHPSVDFCHTLVKHSLSEIVVTLNAYLDSDDVAFYYKFENLASVEVVSGAGSSK